MANVDFGTPESAQWYRNIEEAVAQLLDENAQLAQKVGVDLNRPAPPPVVETPEQELARLRAELEAIKGVPSA